MKLSELMEKLNELIDENTLEHAPYDPEVIIVSEHPWKFLREVNEGKVSNIKETNKVIRLE